MGTNEAIKRLKELAQKQWKHAGNPDNRGADIDAINMGIAAAGVSFISSFVVVEERG